MTTPRTRSILLLFPAGLLVAACGDNQRTPTEPSPPTGRGGAPTAGVVRILIKAPAALAPQQSARLQSTALNADGTTEDVTSRTQWSSADPDVVRVEPGGMVTAVRVGEVGINASYQSAIGTHYGNASVVVLTPGTYKLSGRVTDDGVPVADVNVSIVDGSRVLLTAHSGLDGTFSLYGVVGRVELRASREGYATLTQEIEVTQTTTRNLEMVADRVRPNLSGNYTLVLTLGACDDRAQGTFGTEFASRRYSAFVTQTGAKLAVSLGDAEFITRDGKGDHFSGAVDALGNVRFEIGDPEDLYLAEYPGLVERVTPTAAFIAHGTLTARAATTTTLIGSIAGAFVIAPVANPSFSARSAWCYSDRHRFEMHRR